MTKKPEPEETDPIQSERFRKAVRDLEAAGELNPTDASYEAVASRLLRRGQTPPPKRSGGA